MGPPRGDNREKKPNSGSELATSESSQNPIADESSHRGVWDRSRRTAVRLLEMILLEPQSKTQREQLARKILDYSRMNRTAFEPALIHVPEMADRFREPRRNVRQSLELLQENGTVERTQSRDHWKLSIRTYSPVRAPYDAPRVLSPFPKMPVNPLPGWIELQNRAHKAKDAQEFNRIIDEMNRLLSAHEKAPEDGRESGSQAPEASRKYASSSSRE